MTPIRCRGCLRRIGVATTLINGAYCNEVCADDVPARPNEDRDAIIELLIRTGTDRATVTREFQITKQRLSQVLSKRMVA